MTLTPGDKVHAASKERPAAPPSVEKRRNRDKGARSGALCLVLWLARLVGSPARKVHIVLPATAGSLGDQAVLSGMVEVIRSVGLDAPVQVTLRNWIPHGYPDAPESVRLRVHGSRIRSGLSLAWMLRDCSQLIVLGTDIIEGNYSRSHVRDLVLLSNRTVALGVTVHICGFSFSESPNAEAVLWLRRLDRRVLCSCRDALSARRFEMHVARPAELVTDPAFLLPARLEASTAVDAHEWMRHRRSAGDVLLGVNVNAIAYRRSPFDVCEAFVSALSEVMRRRSVSVLLLPHDLRNDQSDIPPMTKVQLALETEFPGRCRLVGAPVAAGDVKYLAGNCDLIVSGRLHLAVAALSQDRPVIGIEYHDKFRGIFRVFDIEDLLLSHAQLLEEGRLAALILKAICNLGEAREGFARSRSAMIQGISRLSETLRPLARAPRHRRKSGS